MNHSEGTSKPYAYVDGSFNKEEQVYGFAAILHDQNEEIHTIQGSGNNPETARLQNVAGELLAVMKVIQKAKLLHIKELTIYYDYEGIEAWVTGRWDAKNDKTKEYRKYMKECGITINFHKVLSHSGIRENEMVDRLARKACHR